MATSLKISKILYDLGGKWEIYQAYLNIPAGESDTKIFTPEKGKVFIPLSQKIGFSVNYYLRFSMQFDGTFSFNNIRLTDALKGHYDFDLYTPVYSKINLTVTNDHTADHVVDFLVSGILLTTSSVKDFFNMLDEEGIALKEVRESIIEMKDTTRELTIYDMQQRGIDTTTILEKLEKIRQEPRTPIETKPIPHPVDEKPYIIKDGRLIKDE